ncbi:Beta-N-acetylglucosaminidase precursor [Mycobacteroides abscessus subsp. abscessus]|nr:Beta-N-acetylglucosaminidase precursor [Mycobacteroides abscessus subsp. abscessus]
MFVAFLLVLVYSTNVTNVNAAGNPTISYSTHVQSYGWMNSVTNGKLSGTTGKSKRVEAVKIDLKNKPYSGDITYKTHVQSYGWGNNVKNGAVSGTTGKAKRVEAIQLNLTGDMAKHYDVYYRVHSQSYGWLGWAKNGQSAGTEGFSKRVEAMQVVLVKKGQPAPGSTQKPFVGKLAVSYSAHVQNYGWMKSVKNGASAGTTGKSKRVEGIKISLNNAPYSGGITYKTHVQGIGWMNAVSNGKISGTEGKSKRVEAIQISLTGDMAKHYDVYYRVHSQSYGWLDWTKNGKSAGTEGLSKRVESIQIKLVEKGKKAPGATDKPFVTDLKVAYATYHSNVWTKTVEDGATSGASGKRVEAIKVALKNKPYSGGISYKANVQGYGWLDASNGAVSGKAGEGKRIEAIQMSLTGEMANHYDIYYRVYANGNGWLGWAKNGQSAGTQGLAKQIEAVNVVLVEKGKKAPGSTSKPFLTKPSVVYTTFVQSTGWTKNVKNGVLSGTQGQSKPIEAIKINIENSPYSGKLVYASKMQGGNWLSSVTNKEVSGIEGYSKPLEAVKINLSGEIADYYDIYYRVHVQSYGWLGWAKNGMKAGTEGLLKRVEAMEIKLVEKGKGEAASEKNSYRTNVYTTKTYYNISFNNALSMQMKTSPQTDKYRNEKAYASSEYLQMMDKGKITKNDVQLRTSPELKDEEEDNNVAVKVKSGTSIFVLDNNVVGDEYSDSEKWYKIEYKEKEYFVHSSLVKLESKVGRVKATSLNIRSKPSKTSHTYGSVKKGTLLTILKEEEKSKWVEVSYNAWRNATSSDVKYYLDPTNFSSDKVQRFQFMDLTKSSQVPVSILNKYLKGKGILEGQGKAFIDAGKKYGINEVYLMAHTLLETGNGKSTLAKGIEYKGKTVYNMYGIGAYDDCPDECGAESAYKNGWDTPYKAILGGAAFIENGYIGGNNSYNIVQNTIYKMRWNPELMNNRSFAGHQYATDIGWASKQVKVMSEVYNLRPYILHLEIPVYK